MTVDFKMDERYPITPNIYLKGEPILHNRIDSLVSSGWEIIEIRGNVIIDFDTMTSEILRAIKCPWDIPDYGSQWTLDYIEDIDQWLDISHGFFVYISNFDDIMLKNSRIASYLCQHLHRLQTRYRWELLEEGEANLKFAYGFECSEKNLSLVRDFFRGGGMWWLWIGLILSILSLRVRRPWVLSWMSIRTCQSSGLESRTYI